MFDYVAILKVCLEVLLFGIFLYLFGEPSLVRYQDEKVVVVVREEETGGIPAPAVTVCARNGGQTEIVSEACNASTNVLKCMESQRSAKFKDVVLDSEKGEEARANLMDSIFWDLQVRAGYECFTLSMNYTLGPVYKDDMITVLINKSLEYEFFIHSLDYFIPNYNSLIIPSNRFKVFPARDCSSFVSISLVEKHELNTAEDPCVENTQYKFSQCVKESVARQAGCAGQQVCQTNQQYR